MIVTHIEVVLVVSTKMNSSSDIIDLFNVSAIRERALASGITAMPCLFILVLSLVAQGFYIYQYKTTFLHRLFFYFTIASTLLVLICSVYSAVSTSYLETSIMFLFATLSYTLPVEFLVIGSINLTLLSKMFKYRASAKRKSLPSNTEYMLCCCSYTKRKEGIFLFVVFILPVLLSILHIVVALFEPTTAILLFGAFMFAALIVVLVLNLVSVVTLSVWFCLLSKKKLLRNKLKLACKKTIVIMSFFIINFLLFMLISLIFVISLPLASVYGLIAWVVFTTLQPAILPMILLMYVCRSVYKKRNKPQVKSAGSPKTIPPTVPPSTRVSLPTDTAAHAPNFLSPSTVETTIEAVFPSEF